MTWEDSIRAQGVIVQGTLDFQDCVDALARQWSLISGYKITGKAIPKPEAQRKYSIEGGEKGEQT